MEKTADLYRVTFSTVTAGVLVRENHVVAAAPILRWAIGKTRRELTRWVKNKGGDIEQVKQVELGQETQVRWERTR